MGSERVSHLLEMESPLSIDEWSTVQLGDVTELIMGQSPPSETYNSIGLGLPFLQGKAEFGAVYPKPVKWCSNPLRVSPKGSILVSVRAPVGDVNLANANLCIGRGLAAIQPGKQVHGEFLFYYLKRAKNQLEAHGTGTTFQSINKDVLQRFSILLPSLSEQRAIALVLRTVHQAKEATEKVIAATRQLKQSMMKHLFTHGPVPFDQTDKVELKETDFGPIRKDWLIDRLNNCAVVQTGIAKGRKLDTGDAVSLPYLRVANVQDGYLDLSEMKEISLRRSEIQRYSLQDGDVVLTEGGDFDKLGRGFIWRGEVPNCVHQNHIFAVRADKHRLLPEFLAYLTQSSYGKKYFLSVAHKTTNLACINTTKLKAFPTLIPPREEQDKIVRQLETIDLKINKEVQRHAALVCLFQSTLHHLMAGKVRVPVITNQVTAEAV